MSHRKRILEKKARQKKERLELAGPDEPPQPMRLSPYTPGQPLTRFRVTPGEPIEIDDAGELVGEIDALARALRSGAEPELWACLQKIDAEGELLGRLDRSLVDAVAPAARGDALRAFHSAYWTGMARRSGLLEPMKEVKLVGFGIEKYGEAIPQIRHIAGEVPSFHYLFIAVLQDVIKDHLKRARLIPKQFLDADFLPPGQRAEAAGPAAGARPEKGLTPYEYYIATWEALKEFMGVARRDKTPPEAYARDYAPYVFIWIGTSRLLSDIIGGLVTGDPVSRKKRKSGGGFEYIYEKNGRRLGE